MILTGGRPILYPDDMGGYEELQAAIAAVIKTNGTQAITGTVLQNTLTSIVSIIGANATFAGVATPDTDPGSPDQNVFWIAATPGTYTHFGNVVVTASAVLSNETGAWAATPLNFGESYKPLPAFDVITMGGKKGRTVTSHNDSGGINWTLIDRKIGIRLIGAVDDDSINCSADLYLRSTRRGKKFKLHTSFPLATLERSPQGMLKNTVPCVTVYTDISVKDLFLNEIFVNRTSEEEFVEAVSTNSYIQTGSDYHLTDFVSFYGDIPTGTWHAGIRLRRGTQISPMQPFRIALYKPASIIIADSTNEIVFGILPITTRGAHIMI